MNNNADSPDFADAEVEILKQIVHEEAATRTVEEAQGNRKEVEEATTPKVPLELSLQRRLDDLPEKDDGKTTSVVPLTIFRIPGNIRERDRMFYEPQVVSIGPFYRGRENLRAMEEQKIYLLRDFLARYDNAIDVKVLVEEMRLLEDKARRCYAESIELDSREFVEMLLLDGCFILENAIKWFNNETHRLKHVRWANEYALADLFLVENQIPFFVVAKLISLTQSDHQKTNGTELFELLVQYAGAFAAARYLGMAPFEVDMNSLYESRSLLHLCYQILTPKKTSYESSQKHPPAPSSTRRGLLSSFKSCICPQPNEGDAAKTISGESEPVYVFPCATELLQSGVIFKPKKSPTDLFDITFRDGVVEMPPLSLDPLTKITILNVAAFEQSNGENEFLPFTSHVALMENLVKTSKDVVALRQCGVIQTFDPSEEEAAVFFNHAGQVCALDYSNHYFTSLFREISSYYAGRRKGFKNSIARV